jgi:hypothetical protein
VTYTFDENALSELDAAVAFYDQQKEGLVWSCSRPSKKRPTCSANIPTPVS